ncbi:Pol polyprotein [Salix suchowensis]|nr:Pol polyprotein [Salix suchowensis]
MEAVMPLEVEIPSLRVLIDSELDEAEWAKVRYEQLNLISEKRLVAICHHQLYQRRMARSYDKKVRPRKFQEGDLVLKKILFVPGQDQSKWAPNYEGPYVVKKSFSGGALLLSRMDGEDLVRPVNSDSVTQKNETHILHSVFLYNAYYLKSYKTLVVSIVKRGHLLLPNF